jgi:hypothetical protein
MTRRLVIYGIFETLPGLVYYYLSKPINFTTELYRLEDEHRASNFLLSESTNRSKIAIALFGWMTISFLMLLTVLTIFRKQARLISHKEPTIVNFSRSEPTKPKRRWMPWTALPHSHLIRIARICVQIGALLALELLLVLCGIAYFAKTLHNGNILGDWFARAYLEPDTSLTVPGVLWNLFFWYNEVFWALNNRTSVWRKTFEFSDLSKLPRV